MAYTKQEWIDNETLINAERLNHIEDGIADAQSAIPTKTSELENDSGYITDAALDGYATEEAVEAVKKTADSALEKAAEAQGAIPTKVSELENDSGYITDAALDDYAKSSDVEAVKETADAASDKADEAWNSVAVVKSIAEEARDVADEVADKAITAISVNGADVPVENNKAEITVSGGESAIEHIEVNGEEQEIVDKTVNLAIDRASVDDETLIVGDTTGGGSDDKIVHGSFGEWGEINLTGAGMIILSGDNGLPTIYRFGGRSANAVAWSASDYNFESTSDGVNIYDNYGYSETLYTIIYV